MAAQSFTYKKISELTPTSSLDNVDVFVVNHNGGTCKISWSDLKTLINALIPDITSLTTRVGNLETSVGSIGTRLTDAEGTINNILLAGFNLIGVDVPQEEGGE